MAVTTNLRVIKKTSRDMFGRKAFRRDGDSPCNWVIVRDALLACDGACTMLVSDVPAEDQGKRVKQLLHTAIRPVGKPQGKPGIFGGNSEGAKERRSKLITLYFRLSLEDT